jgi:hypothetical protein
VQFGYAFLELSCSWFKKGRFRIQTELMVCEPGKVN